MEYGLQPQIIAAQFVTPFRKGHRTKNDRADAEAIANKHARQIWAMLAYNVDYDPCACLNHPMHQQTYAAHAA